ncbi:MAG: choice-of-anchor D domain-containing protein [Thioploca sp.]|nr:choice-of-anchor D domain-containing protein [Thioploca sp.]
MKHYINSLFIGLSLIMAVVQAAEWEVQSRSIQFQTVWGTAKNDVFALGYHGVIFHYNGTTWQEMDTGTVSHLYGLWGSSGRDVFAVGAEGTILHYNGSTWTTMDSGTVYPLAGVWGSSSRNLFAVGDGGTLLHYDGQTWSTVNSGTGLPLNGIWGSSSNDVFVVGGRGTLLHYNGKDWSTLNSGVSTPIYSIWGSSNRDIFAVGSSGVILHYDGSNWNTMSSETALPLSKIWGSSSSDVFTVGGGGILLHYDGSNWNTMNAGANYYLNGVWGSSSRDVFVVGNGDTILHYDGSLWNTMKRGAYVYLNGIWGTSSQDVFAIGNSNQVFHYDGNKWTTMNSSSPFYLQGIWGTSSTEVFAVGGRVGEGEIIQYDGNNWTGMDSGTTSNLNGIGGNSSSEIFAVGDNGTILRYDGSRWQTMTSGTSSQLVNIWSNSSREVFVVGASGTILQYNGSRWVTMNSGTSADLTHVWGNAGNDVFVVGDKGTILHYDGQAWTAMDSGIDSELTGVWGNSNVDVFASDWAGLILHYDGNRWSEMTKTPTLLNGLWISPEGDAFAVGDAILSCTNCQLGNSAIKVDPRLHNFWNIALNEVDSQTFTISNTGSEKMQLKSLALTNATEFSLSNDTCSNTSIASAGTCQVDVNFQPQSVGTKITKLTLPSQTETLQVPIGGTGCSITFKQVFNLYPELPNLGAIVVGNSITLNQTVSFTAIQGCGEELYIDKIEVVGEHAAEFGIQDTQCDRSSYGKESYSYCQFKTVFTPTSIGEKQAELIFKLSRAELPEHVIPLQAEGIDSSLARLELTPTEHDFGTAVINHGSTLQSFTIKNTGAVSLNVNNIMLIGEHANEFSLENWWCTNYILPPNQQCNTNIWFSPTSVGQKQARLIITSGDLSAEALLKGIAEEPKDCSDANITIKSAQSGRWNVPATWSPSQIPTETDVVRINSGHTIIGQAFAKVRTFCIQAGGVLESADERGTPLEIQATDYSENKGIIRGKNGTNQTKPVCGKADIGTEGCAQPGASVLLKVGTYFDKQGKLGDWWWWGTGGPILNTGEIIAGKGGDGSQYGAPGGAAIVLGRNTTNTNRIQAGDGGNILGTELGEGGLGGLTKFGVNSVVPVIFMFGMVLKR